MQYFQTVDFVSAVCDGAWPWFGFISAFLSISFDAESMWKEKSCQMTVRCTSFSAHHQGASLREFQGYFPGINIIIAIHDNFYNAPV